MNDFNDRLHQAADDTGQPLTTDVLALLRRARGSRQRQRRIRAAGTLGAVAAMTAAVLVVPTLTAGSTSAPAGPTVSPGTTQALADAEIVRRCEPQLEKYFAYPMYRPEQWRVAHNRPYAVGDVVQLDGPSSLGSNPVLCEIPEEGQEQQEVPFARFLADGSDPAALAELCSETFLSRGGTSVPSGGRDLRQLEMEDASRNSDWVDLRGGRVLMVDGDADVSVALIAVGDQHFTCVLSSPTWDAGLTDVYATGLGDVFLNGATTGASNKSIVDETASYYTGGGLTDPAASTIRVTLTDGHVEERPVRNGAYAVMIRIPGEGGLLQTTIEVLDAGGRVLEKYAG